MKRMKKMLACLLSVGLLAGMVTGCGSSQNSQDSQDSQASSAAATETTPTATDSTVEESGETIKVGLLFSFGGSEATLEKCMYNGALLAVEQINEAGGINGKKIEYVAEDYNGEPSLAAEKALKMITEDEVVAIVGCCSSSSRQAVLSVVEEYDNLLVYPISYEGQEYSDNIIYCGVVPNQQSSVLVPWAVENYGTNFYFIGNDYVYPRSTNAQAKEFLEEAGGKVVGEEYVPLGDTDYSSVIANIISAKPDVVFCDLVGDSQTAFYKQYANYGLSDMGITCVNVALDDLVATAAGWDSVEGMVACYDYFPAVGGEQSDAFVEAYNARFDDGSVPASASAVPYLGVQALGKVLAMTDDYSSGKALADLFSGLSVDAPDGTVVFDKENHHVAVPIYIAIAKDGDFEIVYSEEELIAPLPFGE